MDCNPLNREFPKNFLNIFNCAELQLIFPAFVQYYNNFYQLLHLWLETIICRKIVLCNDLLSGRDLLLLQIHYFSYLYLYIMIGDVFMRNVFVEGNSKVIRYVFNLLMQKNRFLFFFTCLEFTCKNNCSNVRIVIVVFPTRLFLCRQWNTTSHFNFLV